MRFNHLTPADYRVVPWANGRGRTIELIRLEDDAGRLHLRLSVADVTEPGAFSSLPGIDRVLMLIEGAGFDLDFAGAAPPQPALPFQPIAFSGDWLTSALDLAGPSRDFNVMTTHGAQDVVVARLAEGPSLWPAAAEDEATGRQPSGTISCFYVANGSAIVGALGLYLQARELLLVEDGGQLDIDAAGDVIAVRLTPRSNH